MAEPVNCLTEIRVSSLVMAHNSTPSKKLQALESSAARYGHMASSGQWEISKNAWVLEAAGVLCCREIEGRASPVPAMTPPFPWGGVNGSVIHLDPVD